MKLELFRSQQGVQRVPKYMTHIANPTMVQMYPFTILMFSLFFNFLVSSSDFARVDCCYDLTVNLDIVSTEGRVALSDFVATMSIKLFPSAGF